MVVYSNNVLHQAMWLFIVLLTNGTDCSFCKFHVCLTWTVNDQLLNLKCRVNRLLFRVEFKDPFNKLVGECIPGRECDSYITNVAIAQNITTNETTCLITGTIDENLNGKWKCLHGTNTGLADVEVTVLRIKDNGDRKCGAKFWSIAGYIVVITLWIAFLSVCPVKVYIVEGVLKKIFEWRCYKSISKMISDWSCCKYNVCRKPRPISVFRGVSLFVLTVLILIIVWCISESTINCENQYYVLCILAPICGFIIAVLCLNKEDAKEAKTIVEDEETQAKQPLNVEDSSEQRERVTI